MLLDRIEIDSCGSLERIQLGPFSHRLNAIYGARGAGKTTALEFLRSVMLGTDRQWHHGSTGSVVWADHDGLLHCRRERDGTLAGRMSLEYVARDGRVHDHHYGYRDPRNYDRLDRMTALPRQTLDAIVAATTRTPLPAILDACRSAGLETMPSVDHQAAIARLRETIATLERQLAARPFGDALDSDAYRDPGATRADLEATRVRLLAELEEITRLERTPVPSDGRREELTARLLEAHDEVSRLGRQESELRHRISELDTELGETGERLRVEDPHLRIATAQRRQLEELDNQLMRWRRTLREVCSLRDALAELWTDAGSATPTRPTGLKDTHYHNSHVQEANPQPPKADAARPAVQRPQELRSQNARPLHWRLESLRRQIEVLVQRYEAPAVEGHVLADWDGDGFRGTRADAATLQTCLDSLRTLREEVSRNARQLGDLQLGDLQLGDSQLARSYPTQQQQLRGCQELLVRFIDRLIDLRNLFLRRLASEYQIPLANLLDTFGDWRQCHEHPQLYQWLLSEKCPPRLDDVALQGSRRKQLEQERAELLEQLGRTVNRLDERAKEIRLLQVRLRETPAVQPPVVDTRRRDACRAELVRVEEALRWLDSRATLEEERQRHQRHLEQLLREATRPSALIAAASRWLSQLGPQPLDPQASGRLWTDADGTLRVDGMPAGRLSELDRQTVAMALRMAAAEELSRRGHQVPLLIDDPAAVQLTPDAPARLAAVLARYSEAGRQLIVLTESRPLADAIRHRGGRVQSLATPQYIQMRYSDDTPSFPRRDSLSRVNRDLDMAWREANGLYDDPYWYRSTDRFAAVHHVGSATRNGSASHDSTADRGQQDRAARGPASPFFLTGDSPVDQAPSIDAVAAERLAQEGVLRVGQLLAADPYELAERLELPEVTPRVVRRWQDEAELVCTVPQLRNFDARVLVGCGFTDAKQLAQMHPGQLLETVEAFLATDHGRRILRSGTSYELSRITSWIAAANRSVARHLRHGDRGRRNGATPVAIDHDTVAEESDRASSRRRRSRGPEGRSDGRSRGRGQRGEPSAARTAAPHEVLTLPRPASTQDEAQENSLRFYLNRRSPVVDAPSIGPKAATRLNRLGIHSIADLLDADPAEVAERLGNRRIDQYRVLRWQQQAQLVCRVPQLRGHDAQLLVAVDIVEPEQLADCDPSQLFRRIDRLVNSPKGRRILRGGNHPDRAEVADWIRWAQQRRSLRAA